MRLPALDKVAFVLSLAVLSFLYGFATQRFDLFLNPVLERAVRQALVAGPAPGSELPQYAAPRVYDREGVRVEQPDRIQPGLTLISSVWEDPDWQPGLRLIDAKGRTVHHWRVDPEEVFSSAAAHPLAWNDPDIQGSYLFPNGDVIVNVEYVGTVRLDACGRVLWRLREGGHHSIARADDGSFWIPGVSDAPPATSPDYPEGLPGLSGPIYHDRLLRVTADGEILQDIDLLQLLFENGLDRHIHKKAKLDDRDVTHLNDIEPLPDSMATGYPLFEAGDLAISLKALDLVLVVDPTSRRVKWHMSHPFIAQHDPDFIGNGWIGVFDNNRDGTKRGTVLGGSRIVLVQPHTDSVTVPIPTPRSESLYTPYRGKWQRLANGNMLLTESIAGRVVEVAPDGSTVWEWVAGPYGESGVPEVSKGVRMHLPPEDVASWPCAPDGENQNREDPGP